MSFFIAPSPSVLCVCSEKNNNTIFIPMCTARSLCTSKIIVLLCEVSRKVLMNFIVFLLQDFVVSPVGPIEAKDLFNAVVVGFRIFYTHNKKYPEEIFVLWLFLQIITFKLPAAIVPTQVDSLARLLSGEPVDEGA